MNNPLTFCARTTLSLKLDWWALPLRLMIGFGFMFHGYAKLSHGPEHFARILDALHLPAPVLLAWLTTITELAGGFAIMIGAFVPIAAIPLAFVLVVAILTVHLPNGFDGIKLMGIGPEGLKFGKPGMEADLMYLAGLIALAVGGESPLSLDRMLFRRFRDRS